MVRACADTVGSGEAFRSGQIALECFAPAVDDHYLRLEVAGCIFAQSAFCGELGIGSDCQLIVRASSRRQTSA